MVTKIAVGQCRVSKGDTKEIENSLISQQREIRQFAEKKLGIKDEQIDWFIEDEARSSYQDRANWQPFEQKIQEACTNNNICYFISYSQERFCRNTKRSKIYKDLLRKCNIEVRFVTGDIEDPNSIEGFVQESFGEMNAQVTSMKISLDTIRGCIQNAQTIDPETGYVYQNGGSAQFWLMPYKRQIGTDRYQKPINKTYWAENTTIHTAIIDGKSVFKTMWEWGKYIFVDLRLRQCKSYKEIADFANSIKLPIARKSELVRKNTISLQAKHEILYGKVIYNKRHYNNNHKKGELKNESEWVVVENGVPALLTKEQYDLLQLMASKKARKKDSTSSNSKNDKLLVDIPEKFYCASCGSKIISSGEHYVCSEYNSHGRAGCKASSFYVPSKWLDDKVQKEIIKLYLSDDTVNALYDQYVVSVNKQKVQLDDNKLETSNIKKQIASNEQKAKKIMDNITSGNVIGLALKTMSEQYNTLMEKVGQLKEALAEIEAPKHYRILTYDYFKALCKQNSKVLAHSLLPQRRAFVAKCIEAVILDPVRKEVHIKLDISPFLMKKDDVKTAKKLEVSAFDTSSEMVAGAGFEPTTFGL